MMDSTQASVMMDSQTGRCLQRAGWREWCVILVMGMSNMMFVFAVAAPSNELSVRFISLISEIGCIRCLFWRTTLEFLI